MQCPLCNSAMARIGNQYVCSSDSRHILLVDKELSRYQSGEKTEQWLKARMKVRMGKIVHGR